MKRALAALLALVILSAIPWAQTSQGPVAHWSAADLKPTEGLKIESGPLEVFSRPLLTTPTHRFSAIRMRVAYLGGSGGVVLHSSFVEGATNIFFVVEGQGYVYVGGGIETDRLVDQSGRVRIESAAGVQTLNVREGAIVNIPPSTPFLISGNLTLVRLEVNVGMHPWSIVSTQQNTLPDTPAHPHVTVPLNSTQGEVKFWSADQLQKTHATMAAAAAKGTPITDPRDLVELPATRTHAWNFLHRVMGANNRPPGVEYHGGNTDIYFIIAGTGTLMTGGEIENREPIPNRPLEERGTLIKNGVGYKVKAGDVVNMPPNTPHQSIPDAGGFSYMLVKVNTGQYPWELIK